MEELFIKEVFLYPLLFIATAYIIGLMMIFLIVLLDKERKSIYHKTINVFALNSNSKDRVVNTTFFNLQGQEIDEVIEVFSITKPKEKIRKVLSKNQQKVSSMNNNEINQSLKEFGIISELKDEQKGALLVEYLDGVEIGNLRKLYSDGELKPLRKFAEARIRFHPNEIIPQIILVRAYFKLKMYEECIDQCNSILSFEPNYVDAFRFIARAYRATDRSEKAAEIFKKLTDIAWDDIDSRFSLMKYYWNNREYSMAQNYVNELLQLAPDEIRYHVYSGRILQRLNQNEKAMRRWNILLALDIDNIDALLGLGQSCYALGDFDLGLKFLLMANEIDEKDSRVIRAMIKIYISLGFIGKALDCLKYQCENDPLNVGFWTQRISLLLRTYGDSHGDSLLDEVIQNNPNSLEGYFLAIVLANDFSLINKEKDLLSQTLSKFPNHFEIYLELSKRLMKSDFIGKAYFYSLKAQDLSNQSPDIKLIKEEIETFLSSVGLTNEALIENGTINKNILKTELVFSKIINICENNVNNAWKFERKIAMVSSTLGRGGAERQVVACLSGLISTKRWADVKLFCNIIDSSKGKYKTFEKEVVDLGVPIMQYGQIMGDKISEGDFETEVSQLLDLLPLNLSKSIRVLANEFLLYKPSIVHSWQDGMNIIAAVAAFISGVPNIIMFARSLRPDQKTIMHTYKKNYYKESYKSILGNPRAMLVHNSKTGVDSYANWLGMENSDFNVIYNGIDFERVLISQPDKIQDIVNGLNLPTNAFIVGSVFRIVDEKRPRLWVETATKIIEENNNAHFILVGGGALLETIQQEIEEIGFSKQIHLIGQSNEVAAWLELFDLFLLTSRVEGLPNVLIEAQMMGLPVVSTDAGGAIETFIDGETGYLCMEATSSSLSEIITSVMNDEQWMFDASVKAKEISRIKFGQKKMISTLLDIYEESIG